MEITRFEQRNVAVDRSTEPDGVDRLLLTISGAATALSVGRTTVYALIAAGELPVVHIGRSSRVPVEAVREFVAAKRAGA